MAVPSNRPKTSSSSTPNAIITNNDYPKSKKNYKGERREARLLASRMWYQNPEHRLWKKKYNADYYRANVDKWNKYYRLQKKRLYDANDKLAKSALEPSFIGPRPQESLRDIENVRNQRVKLEAVKIARQEAINEYDFYMDTHKKMPIKEAWSDGAEQIKDAGKKFIQKFKELPGVLKKK